MYSDEVVLFSTGCPQCKVLEAKLNRAGISYRTEEDTQELIDMGLMSVPVLRVGGFHYRFPAAVNWVNSQIK